MALPGALKKKWPSFNGHFAEHKVQIRKRRAIPSLPLEEAPQRANARKTEPQ
jgi:hypothetical protein